MGSDVQAAMDDDDTLIGIAWLRYVASDSDALGVYFRNAAFGYELSCTHQRKHWTYMGRNIRAPKTRGEFRQLCKLLGIPLTEPSEQKARQE